MSVKFKPDSEDAMHGFEQLAGGTAIMKRLIPTLMVALVAAHAHAQVITTLKSYRYNVTPVPPAHLVRAEDGALYGMNSQFLYRWQPDGSGFSILKESGGFVGPLSLSGNTLYGMDSANVFKVNTDGSGYTILKEEILDGSPLKLQILSTYGRPGVVLSGNTLYGWGFKINTDGTAYTELPEFPNWDGLQYWDWYLEFAVSGDKFFGATSRDGQYGAGTVFRLNSDGTDYTVLANVTSEDALGIGGWRLNAVGDTLYGYGFPDRMFKVATDGTGYSVLTNGNFPGWNNRLEHSGGVFYWTAAAPTNNRSSGAIFKMNTNGTGYAELKRFTESNHPDPATQGYVYVSILTVAGDTIYGTAQSPRGFDGAEGGLDGRGGALFKMNTDGSGFAVLHEFSEPNPYPDGRFPESLTVSGSVLYGFDYGPDLNRRLFRLNTDGTGFTSLKGYDLVDRFDPMSRPTVSGSTLFGVGGSRGILQEVPYNASRGLVYRMNSDGTGYTVLKDFTSLADGNEAPAAALALSGSALYGTIGNAGPLSHSGKIFKVNTDGTGYTVLRTFGPLASDPSINASTNGEGLFMEPSPSELIAFGNTLYGAAFTGGQLGYGTVFKLNTDGTGFTVLKHFSEATPYPRGRLTLSGNTLYGISSPEEAEFGWGGTVFRVNTDGTGFMVVKQFPDAVWDSALGYYTNSEGVKPIQGLALQGKTLYGTTSRGGQFGMGTLFKVDTDGTGFAVLQHIEDSGTFNGLRGLVLSGNTIYGAAPSGGDQGVGAICRIDLAPTLSLARTGSDSLAVSWPSVWADYVLQQNMNGFSFLNWSNVTTGIQDDGTNKTLIVIPTEANGFFRLFKP